LTGLGGLGVGFTLGAALNYTPFESPEIVAASLTFFFAMALIQGVGTGVFAHESEMDFVFTAPVKPREYLVADFAFQWLMYHAMIGPAEIGGLFGFALGSRGGLLAGIQLILLLEGFMVLLGLLSQAIGVLALGRFPKAARLVVALALVGLILPALRFVIYFPLRYSDLPLPSTYMAQLLLTLMTGGALDGVALAGFLAWLGLAFLAWFAVSNTNFFPGVKPAVIQAFGQPVNASQMMTRMAARRKRKVLFAVNVFRGRLIRVMTSLQIVKWLRTGMLAGAIAITLMWTFLWLAPGFSYSGGGVTSMSLLFIAVMLPAFLALPSVSGDRDRLWVYSVLPGGASLYFQSLFLGLTIVASIVVALPALVMSIATGRPDPVGFVSLIAGASGANLAGTLFLTRFKVPLASFSLNSLLFLFVCGIGALLGAMPGVVLLFIVPGDMLIQILVAVVFGAVLVLVSFSANRLIGTVARVFVP